MPSAQEKNKDKIAIAIAKISTREIRLPNIHEIKYAQKLVRIRYLICWGELMIEERSFSYSCEQRH